MAVGGFALLHFQKQCKIILNFAILPNISITKRKVSMKGQMETNNKQINLIKFAERKIIIRFFLKRIFFLLPVKILKIFLFLSNGLMFLINPCYLLYTSKTKMLCKFKVKMKRGLKLINKNWGANRSAVRYKQII